MNESERIRWHKIIQDMLDHYLGFMSGKVIKGKGREQQRYIRGDYFCRTEGDLLPSSTKNMTRPFDHLNPYSAHLIEYKSLWQVLNESTFREYVGRALVFQNADPQEGYLYRLTLTILTTRKPESLIDTGLYAIEQVNDWKYISRCFPRLEITILVIKGMRDKKEGEAFALLQILDPEGWPSVFSQNLENTAVLEGIAKEIGKEAYMNLLEEVKRERTTEIVRNLLNEGMEISVIVRATGLSEEEIMEIKNNLKAE